MLVTLRGRGRTWARGPTWANIQAALTAPSTGTPPNGRSGNYPTGGETTPAGCWPWLAGVNRHGYGVVMYTAHCEDGTAHRPQLMVHRLAYMRFVGDLYHSEQVDHTCHDPAVCLARNKDCLHRRCFNPDHLEPVAAAVNLMRSGNSTAVNAAITHCDRNHEFTPENTYIASDGSRNCRACKAMHAVKANAAAKASRWAAAALRVCKICGADINHRALNARFCELCTTDKRMRKIQQMAREAEDVGELLLF